MNPITDQDIDNIEREYFGSSINFDKERRDFIKILSSVDVQACPGSGKTTALVAKLALIAKQLPLDNGRGICVLTHTNIAIDEIKERLGPEADILFNYPNHFGTIQSFVDKFLAIPAYVSKYKKRPYRIDDEGYCERIKWKYENNVINYGLKTWINRSYSYDPIGSLQSFRFDNHDMGVIVTRDGEPLFKNRGTASEQSILSLKEEILQKGVMCYDDAYALSFAYIRDFGDKLKKIFGNRFAYVFIDEMQDTDKQQLMLIEELFSDDSIEIQKIGDNNQAIYSSTVNEQNLWSVNSTNLTINGSKRFSKAIAEKVKLFALNQQEIIGNTSLPDINPKILVFNDQSISRVLSKFAEIIISNNLDFNTKKIFKAVGWVGQVKDKRTIPSYYENYVSKRNAIRQDYDCLKGYLQKCPSEIMKNEVVEHYRYKIIRALLKVLRVLNFKDIKDRYYTETSLTQQIFKKTGNKHFYDNFRFSMATWCLKLLRNEDIYDNVKKFIIEEFLPLFNVTGLSYITPFLDGEISEDQVSCVSDRDNISKQDEIEIQVSTIHGVKGETHTATLYLETHFHQYDIKKIVDYMKGNFHEPQPMEKEALKMAYVGMSRPSHLLCIAAHIDSINGHEEGLKNNDWDIVIIG